MQPSTPMVMFGFCLLSPLKWVRRFRTVCSAFSRIEQVFKKITSAFFMSEVVSYPLSFMMEATISESEKFIAQP